MKLSPTGKRVVESSGPLSASLVFVGESPGENEVAEGIPFVGKSGKILNAALRSAGIDRASVRLINCIPVRAPGDKFAAHDPQDVEYGKAAFRAELSQLPNARIFVALGANPTEWLLGGRPPVATRGERPKEGFIGEWRGSILPVDSFKLHFDVNATIQPMRPEDYLGRLNLNPPSVLPHGAIVIPTFHPAAIFRQMTWHPWLLTDVRRAAQIDKHGLPPTKYREWHIQDAAALRELAASQPGIISYDTELDPYVVGIATEHEVHVFEWTEEFREPLTELLTNAHVLKVAHNWLYDYAFTRKRLEINVQRPIFDTQGAAHLLNNALQKELSPHISTRFTNWPYHKWLSDHDTLIYCGMDAVVCFDAYWPQLEQLTNKGLLIPVTVGTVAKTSVAEHDHKLLMPLMDMQAVGFKINETARKEVELELKQKLDKANAELQALVEPIVDEHIGKFEKPHLFRVLRKCSCCGGGKVARQHCDRCHVGHPERSRKENIQIVARLNDMTQKEVVASWGPCVACNGIGKVTKKLEFNSDSPDQIADVIYRGLKIRARKYKGNETTKAAQLNDIRDRHPVVARLVDTSALRADFDTVSRLTADSDGLLHCEFDPFGTKSGRVAGKEGLLEVGTNPMNLPVEARRFVVPRPGKIFLYPDMAQIEARALAVLSGDKNLINAFTVPVNWPGHEKHGKLDSHTSVVQMMLASGAQITRPQAKRLVYAIMNGGRAAQLAVELNAEAFSYGESLRLTTQQVQYMIDVFYRAFPRVKQWQTEIKDEVFNTRQLRNPLTGRIFTWLGYIVETRKRSPDYGGLKYEIAKQVFARCPQDTAAWILGQGLIEMYYDSGEWGKLIQPLVHVHDALLIEAPIDRVEEAKKLSLHYLTRDAFGIRFEAEMKTGMNWLEASGG